MTTVLRTAADRLTGWLHAILLTALAGLVVMAVIRLPEPTVDRMVEADIRAKARIWHQRLVSRLDRGAYSFEFGRFTASDESYLRTVPFASDIHRLKLYDADALTIFSSRPEEMGEIDNDEDFAIVRQGRVQFEQDVEGAEEIDNADLHIGPEEQRLSRVVAEVMMPVMHEGRFVGAIEFYHDVTTLRDSWVARVRAVLGGAAGATLLLLTLLYGGTLRSSRRRVAEVSAQAEKARALMAEQLRLSREVRLLSELNEWLQSSKSLDELFAMVARFMAHILPGSAGSLYVYSNSRDVLDGAASWSGGHRHDHIRPEDCWGLRRGRTYAFGENAVDFACTHHGAEAPKRHVCIPIIAHGETVGLMSLVARPDAKAGEFEESRRLAQTCAEQISMAIANVRMRDELQHQAIRDPLTGLFNQRHMIEALRRHIESRAAREVSLVSLDVDHFKRFNDNFGHDAGDMVLRAVGEVLGRHADGDEVACRVGGEEFALVLPGLSPEEALIRAERARHDVAAIAVRYGDRTLPRVTVSVGVAHCPTHGTMPQAITRAADEALYAAKARGRNQVVMAGEAARPADDWDRDLQAEAAGDGGERHAA